MDKTNITPKLCDALSKLTYAEWRKVRHAMDVQADRAENKCMEEMLAPSEFTTGAELEEIIRDAWG